jgi:hypothetical protein
VNHAAIVADRARSAGVLARQERALAEDDGVTPRDYPPRATDLDDARRQLAFILLVLSAPDQFSRLVSSILGAYRAKLAELERDEG